MGFAVFTVREKKFNSLSIINFLSSIVIRANLQHPRNFSYRDKLMVEKFKWVQNYPTFLIRKYDKGAHPVIKNSNDSLFIFVFLL